MKPFKRFTAISVIVLFYFFITSCDKIEPPYAEKNGITLPDSGKFKRKVLLEDYTGHTCPNCPKAGRQADTLVRFVFPGQVVVMSIHVGVFADTHPGAYSYDFKTPEGTQLDNDFQLSASGLPKGMVNRTGFPAQTHKKEYTSWASEIGTQLLQPAAADIQITNHFDSVSRSISTTIKSTFITANTGTYYLSAFYVEDSIIQPQVDGAASIPDYVHMHVLRGSFNGTYGEPVAVDPAVNFSGTKQYATTLRTDAVPKNCRVVAFIYNNATKEILQADEKAIE